MSLEALLPQLQDPEQPVASTSLASLSGLDASDRQRFFDVWRVLSIQRRRDVVDHLSDLAEDNVELDFNDVFLAALLDDDVQVRADAIKALWEYEDPDFISLLFTLLRDREALVRAEAALGLGRFLLRAELNGDDSAPLRGVEDALRRVIADDAELAEVRGRAIEALGARSASWVREIIENAYAGGDRRLRISAVHAMGRNANPDWLSTIYGALESDDAELRFEAAVACGSIGDEESGPRLVPLIEDEDAEVQEAAIEALGQIGGASARSILTSLAAESTDQRLVDAANEALAEADFVEDPLGYRLRLTDDPDDDLGEEFGA